MYRTPMNPSNILTKEPPRSAHERLGGFVILSRTIDKARASLAGCIADYHFDGPLDRMLFSFKGVNGQEFLRPDDQGSFASVHK